MEPDMKIVSTVSPSRSPSNLTSKAVPSTTLFFNITSCKKKTKKTIKNIILFYKTHTNNHRTVI
ncbi:BnaC05g10440D [Brassica napus]|uniref:BnaC05g10440D protein n=1 Tax=Brassica napus TaxID=3708 RepID=A0A078HLJ9_BRANA|nr:BnaC05g10440D [Brassica napus]